MSNNNNNGRKKGGLRRAAPPGPTAGQKLISGARSELQDAGLELFGFFESMMDPEDSPPMRVPDAHNATSAVFKTPFVTDLPFSGQWDGINGRTAVIDEKDPLDGYSEVILCPGSTDCYFYTLGEAAQIWPLNFLFERLMAPILATHPVATDLGGLGTRLVQGLRVYNGDVTDVAILPKLDSTGIPRMECTLTPVNTLMGETLRVLLGFTNKGITASSRTNADMHVVWSDGSTSSFSRPISSRGDNDGSHSTFYSFTFQLPVADAFVTSFYVEVSDIDPGAHWVYSMAQETNDFFSLSLPLRSACAFRVVDAPELNALSETLSERTTSLVGLLTYMGSTLQDGGQIAAARLGMGLSPLRSPAGDVYTYLASLPFYNADFALREGIYSWWLPDSVQEHFYVPYRAPRSDDLEYNAVLQYAMHRDTPTQAVRLKAIQNLEVITRSRLYTSIPGPNNPAYSTLIGAMKLIPAVTINRKHKGILGRALGWLKGIVSKPANWRKLIKYGASIIQKMAPGSGAARVAGGLNAVIG
jgi:hypothetical protein